jgi:hypothetical protein
MTDFKVGDIVISKKGTRPFRIGHLRGMGCYQWGDKNYVCGVYLHNNHTTSDILKSNLIHYNENTMQNYNMTALYSFEIDGQTKYGHHIGTNSLGQCVVEEKGGTGQIYTLEKSSLQEVVPYTVHMREMGTTNWMDVISREGVYSVNELILYHGKMWMVIQLNNKAKNGVEITNARRVLTEEIK